MSSPMDRSGVPATDRLPVLVRAALALTAEHDLDSVLEQLVASAAELVDARHAALAIYGEDGRIERFVHHGVPAAQARAIGSAPRGAGVLGELRLADRPLRLAEVSADAAFEGFPKGHPEMHTFLGVPVRTRHRRLGNLYLAEKLGGAEFDEEDEQLVVTLAAFAASAVETAQLAAAEAHAQDQRELFAAVIDAQEGERARVARDLHDQIGQSLTSVLLGLRLLTDVLTSPAPDVAEVKVRTEEVRQLVADALQDVRDLAFALRPTVLDDIGLVAAVRRLGAELTKRQPLELALGLDGLDDDSRFPSEVETVVFRVVQESLTNVIRHAAARRVVVELAATASELTATIADDGCGFDPRDNEQSALGLWGMAERAASVGGHLAVESTVGSGTTVRVEVPHG